MDKLINIKKFLQRYKKILVAFSGGVDSSLLLFLVKESGVDYEAVTFLSYLYADSERILIDKFVKEFDIKHRYISIDPLAEIEEIANNPKERCYFCKYKLYSKLNDIKRDEQFDIILDGSNADDKKVLRPGAKATAELGILSPLAEFGFTKDEIRNLSKSYNLPMHDKPSLSCYLTRFEYGVNIDKQMIAKVAELEGFLHSLSLISARCRIHNGLVRIQLDEKDLLLAIGKERKKIVDKCTKLGYKYTTIDLGGSYSGSMDR